MMRDGFIPWRVVIYAPDGSQAAEFERERLWSAVADIKLTAKVLDCDQALWYEPSEPLSSHA